MPKKGWPSMKDVVKADNPHFKNGTKSAVGGTARTVGTPENKRPPKGPGRRKRNVILYGGD